MPARNVVPAVQRPSSILRATPDNSPCSFHKALEFGVIRDFPEIEAIQEFHSIETVVW